MTENNLPRWDLSNVYPGLDSPELIDANKEMISMVEEMDDYILETKIDPTIQPPTDPKLAASIISGFIEKANTLNRFVITINAYISSFITTDSYDNEASKALSELQQVVIRIQQQQDVLFTGWLGKMNDILPEIIESDPSLKEHSFFLEETVLQSKYLMSSEEEELASELSLSGATAWAKLHGTITSQLKWKVEQEDGTTPELPLTQILNFRDHENELMRKRGYEAEGEAWKSVENQLAACMNGVKGQVLVLDKRRGRKDPLERSLDQARIDKETLEAMMSAMKDSFPMFRRYFKAKAQKLGKEKLPWWDIFAPMGKLERSFSYPEAQEYVLENFEKFSPELSAYAKRAFDNNWIDDAPRDGKRAGAFCMGVPGVNESRILLNFDGNLNWVFTLAHELGHGFHNDCQTDRTMLQRDNPMTLAETASIMCETIVTNAAINEAKSPQEELAILETKLNGESQVVVDIYSRFLFETEVFKRRDKAELSAQELNEIMLEAQKETYGDGMDLDNLQQYMWTWKPHYYSAGRSFYNYPYTFGLLFGSGLYAIYKERGDAFIPQYKDLLSSTGMGTAADLAARFDIDLRSPGFWKGSLDDIEQYVERYEQL